MTRRLLFIVMSVFLTCLAGWARPEDDSYTRLARVSYIEGHASFQHSSDVDWTAASINLPLEPGDRIYAGQDGRVEIEFDDGSICRLAENTDLQILSLKEELIQLRLLVGLSTLTVSSNLDFEIDTPAAAFSTMHAGVYRFDVVENGDTDAVVRKGELEAANNEFSRRVESGELLHVSRGGLNPVLSQYNRRDQWDEWNDRRTADLNAYASRKYVPENVYMGASELDRYGRWVDVDTYGTAWVPYSVDTYWSPYSIGRWCYRPFYGWTWVSYEPWGWLPYHYGRWYRSMSFGWCWLPGPAFGFNFWSPALVAFYDGPGWISWCPLGPGDYYNINHYHYNHGRFGYQVHDLLALHTRPPESPFHRNTQGAFRTAQIEQFRNGTFNGRSASTRWNGIDQPWREGSLVRDRLPVQPSTASFGAAPDRPAARPRGNNALPAVVRTNPGADAGHSGQFSRITNPQIPAAPSTGRQNRNEPRGPETGGGLKPNVRVEPGTRGSFGDRPEEQGGRMSSNPPRWSVNPGNREVKPGTDAYSPPVARPDNSGSSNQQNAPKPRYERITPEPKPAPQPPREPRQQKEDRPQNSYAEPRPGFSGRSDGANQSAGQPRMMNSAPAYNAPTYRAPSYSAPTYSAPRPSNPSFQRNEGGRTYSAPSSGSGGGGQAPSFSRPSSGSGPSHGENSSGGRNNRR